MTRRRFTALGLLFCLAVSGQRLSAGTPQWPLAGKIIVLDPGHAVKSESGSILNPGAKSRKGDLERDIALQVGAMMVPLLESQGAVVYLTRTPTNPWRYASRKASDNRARAIQANLWKADAYVRIHFDWNRSKKFEGLTTYYYRWGSRPLAASIHESLIKALPAKRDNGVRRKSFVSVTAKMPTVLLELGVLSNPGDAKDLARGDHHLLLAQAVTGGLVDYFQK